MKYISIFLFLMFTHNLYAQKNIFVSVNGDDNNTGSKESPFLTLERAKQEIRKIKKTKSKQAFVVYIREGDYRLDETFNLYPEDSGIGSKYTVTYKAYNDENVTLSSTKKFNAQWTKYNGNIWRTKLSLSFDKGFVPRHIWINDECKSVARYPNRVEDLRPFEGVAKDCLSKERASKWKTANGAYVHGMQHGKWGSMHYRMLGVIDSTPHLELVSTNTTTMYNNAQLHPTDRFVENVFEELDAAGEWYYDRYTNYLYYYAEDGMDLKSSTLEIPQQTSIIRFNGSHDEPVKYISFENISFRKSLPSWYKTQEHLPIGDYAINREGAITIEGSENCKISNCKFSEIGGNGIVLSNYNFKTIVEKCHFDGVEANGIILVGNRSAMRDRPWCDVTDNVKTISLAKERGYILSYRIWNEPYRETEQSKDWTPGPKNMDFPHKCIVRDNSTQDNGIDDKIYSWNGAKIKNMTNDAEKSAAGIDDIKGVIIVEIPENSLLYKCGGRVGDVILKCNGKDVKTIKDLLAIEKASKKDLTLWVDGNPPAHNIVVKK